MPRAPDRYTANEWLLVILAMLSVSARLLCCVASFPFPRETCGCCAHGGSLIGELITAMSCRQALALIAHEVTLRDDKARKELGYTSHMSVDEGMAEITVKKRK